MDRGRAAGEILTDESGIGLVDVCIAGAILMLAVLVIPMTLDNASRVNVNATTRVVATGIARQYVSSLSQQLRGDGLASFPSPFLACQSDGSSDTPLCQPQGTGASTPAVLHATCSTPQQGATTCSALTADQPGSEKATTSITIPRSVFGGSGSGQSIPDFTVTTTGEWVCQEASVASAPGNSGTNLQAPGSADQGTAPTGVLYNQGANGNQVPTFEIQVNVTWKYMITGNGVTLYVTIAPPPGISTQSPPPPPDSMLGNTGNTPPCA